MTPESLVRETDDLFSFPEAALRVNELIDQTATTIEDLANVIRTDPALSARLLRLVNSAYYARQTPVDTISLAIPMIGWQALRDLVMGTAVVEIFQDLPPDQINMERFWFHGVACGVAARELDEQLGFRGGEQLFLAGLLHGIGKLVFFSRCPREYRNVLDLIDAQGLTSAAAEDAVFGFNYAELGGELLRVWHFPERIWQIVAHHLAPGETERFHREAELINAAERIAVIVQQEHFNNPISGVLKAQTTASDTVENASERIQTIAAQLGVAQDEASNIFQDIRLRVVDVFEVLVRAQR
jgi:HD-like signal output (HDOD) protein